MNRDNSKPDISIKSWAFVIAFTFALSAMIIFSQEFDYLGVLFAAVVSFFVCSWMLAVSQSIKAIDFFHTYDSFLQYSEESRRAWINSFAGWLVGMFIGLFIVLTL